MKTGYDDEERIIWLKDRDTLSRIGYVRERLVSSKIRTGPVRPPAGEDLIGYAVLKKTALAEPGGGFIRRIFTLKPSDRCCGPQGSHEGSVPGEAVDPMKVQAGVAGRQMSSREHE